MTRCKSSELAIWSSVVPICVWMYETPATPARKFREVGSSVQEIGQRRERARTEKGREPELPDADADVRRCEVEHPVRRERRDPVRRARTPYQPPRTRRKGPERALAKTHRRTIKYETRFFS